MGVLSLIAGPGTSATSAAPGGCVRRGPPVSVRGQRRWGPIEPAGGRR